MSDPTVSIEAVRAELQHLRAILVAIRQLTDDRSPAWWLSDLGITQIDFAEVGDE